MADNYYTPPLLVLYIVYHTVFRLGTIKRNKIRVPGTFKFRENEAIPLENKGDTRFARKTKPKRELPSWNSGT